MKFSNLILFVFISSVLLLSGCDKDDPVSPEETITVPTVVTADITEIKSNTATGGGEVTNDGGADVTARGAVWSANQLPTLESNDGYTTNGIGTGTFTSNITNLTPGTTYYVRAYATNSAGNGYGNGLGFTTDYDWIVSDIDGNVYRTVRIGNQLWMAENLRTTRYRNGDAIPTNLSNDQWENTTSGAYAIYPHDGGGYTEYDVEGIGSDAEMVAAYGKLYNWYAVDDDRGLCPEGWHVPTDAEWTVLVDYVVAQGYPNTNVVGGAGNALKSRRQLDSPLGAPWATSEHPRWNSHGRHHGLDVFGFSGLPGGYRNYNGGHSLNGILGDWWSSTESGNAWYRSLKLNDGNVSRSYSFWRNGFSVRCLRDF